MSYQRRIIDELLDEVLSGPVALAIEGAKGVGKTATAKERSQTTFALDDPSQLPLLQASPDVITQVPQPVLIDEWQLYPPIWDRVRRAVDEDFHGTFLLTGSAATPSGSRIHSGAGRIVRVPMRPLSIAERDLDEPTVSLSDLLKGGTPEIRGTTQLQLPDYVDEILYSGFPGIRTLPDRLRKLQLTSYIDRLMDSELAEAGLLVRRPDSLRRWLTAYAAATASNASYTNILDAATAGEHSKPARSTVDSYREHLTRLFILDPVPAWTSTFSPLKRLTVTPKHHLVDPALAAILMGLGKTGLLTGENPTVVNPRTGTWLGALFESLATQSVRTYAWAAESRIGHLRTHNTDREIDLIVEREDGRVVALEIKLAATVHDQDVRHLNWLSSEIGDKLADRVVITTGTYAYRRPDGVAVVPLALLGP